MDKAMESEYPRMRAADLAVYFGKSPQAVRARAWLLGLTNTHKQRGGALYTEEFADRILAEYAYRPPSAIARDYNMTRDQVWWVIRRAQTSGRQA